ncbi:unnamed protein product [Arctogadus glacialis]
MLEGRTRHQIPVLGASQSPSSCSGLAQLLSALSWKPCRNQGLGGDPVPSSDAWTGPSLLLGLQPHPSIETSSVTGLLRFVASVPNWPRSHLALELSPGPEGLTIIVLRAFDDRKLTGSSAGLEDGDWRTCIETYCQTAGRRANQCLLARV